MSSFPDPLGAVLAGGAGTRLGGAKATAELAGRPLIAYPLAAFAAAGIETIVVAKADTELPPLDAPVIIEPQKPRHPLLGVVTALDQAGGRPVVTCPCDTPFANAALLAELAAARTTTAVHDGKRLHPLIARFEAAVLPSLRAALDVSESVTATVEALVPGRIEVDERTAFNVNTPADLNRAAALIEV